MTRLESYIKKKKLIIFDLDGVLIDSRNNMRFAWQYVRKQNNLITPFEDYFKYVGLPFKEILKKINLRFNHEKIRRDFSLGSIRNLHKIKPYPFALLTLKKLKKKGKIIALLTSKDLKRTKKIIKKLKIKFDHMECGNSKVKGKPNPYQILRILKKFKCKKSESVYVGDVLYDYLTSKRAKIDFIFAKYGYGKLKYKKFTISKLTNLYK